MNTRILQLFLFLLTMYSSQAQKIGIIDLSRDGINKAVNNKMSSLTNGNSTGSSPISFASLDPADGSFTFKGSLPLTSEKNNDHFAFMSLRLQGDLISENISTLFKNRALNTGSAIDLQIHYRFEKGLSMYYANATEESRIKRDKSALKTWHIQMTNTIKQKYSLASMQNSLNTYKAQNESAKVKLQSDISTRDAILNNINAELHKAPPDPIIIGILNTQLTTILDQISSLEKQIRSLTLRIDSVNIVQQDSSALLLLEINNLNMKNRDSLDKIESSTKLAGLRFSWFSLTLGTSNKAYYTYSTTLPFSQQLNRETFETFRVGLAYNYYAESSFPSSVFYANFGFLWYRDNNIRFLSTKQLVQERVLKNSVGDTVRKFTKTYTIYEDPILNTNVTSIYTNLYFMNKDKTIGLHLYPSFDLISKDKDIANIGVGIITSFKNEKKDKAAINLEAYFKWNDMFDNYATSSPFWNRTEAGVSFSIPINLF
jgi:hypothetical protein